MLVLLSACLKGHTQAFPHDTKITEAYIDNSSILIHKLSFTFGIPLTLQLEQTTNDLEV